MKIMQSLSEMPATTKNVATFGSLASLIGSVIWGAFFLDGRYAHAEDMEKAKKDFNASVVELRIEAKQDRRRQLDDKVFEIQTKPKVSDVDRAVIDRTKSEIQEIDQQINELQQKIKN
jgi:peptidoglycan hydrolase CwlO-like protein